MGPWHEVVSEPGSPEPELLRIGKSFNESWRVVPVLPDVQLDLQFLEFILQKSDRMSSSLTLASLLGGRQDRPPFLLPPVEAAEVWGCGVTYLRSRDAREDETLVKGIYDRVYESERPELFFKGNP